ncbi:MAG TPA: ABC transporter permease, partial [Acidimicrobiales bacterium]|nr:ABC transporter permease [Acidimicrobiales bacterium]
MQDFLTFFVAGLAGGSSYALLALGLVLVNKSSRILNFAQGEIGAMATFVVASLAVAHGWAWLPAIAVGLAVGAAISVATSLVLLQRGAGGRLPPLVGTVALLGLLVIVENRWFGGARPFPSPIHGGGVEVAGVVITPTRLLIIGSVAVTCVLLWLLVERTRVGLALRAGADNRDAAVVIGIQARRVQAVAWLLAGVLGVLAGLFLGWTNQSIAPGFLTAALPRAFTGAILGGMTSLPGAVVGGLVVGVAESLTRWQWGQTPGSAELVVFAILFLTLLLRPQGLFGRRASALSTEATESLVTLRGLVRVPPAAGRALARRGAPAVVIAVVAALAATVPNAPTAYKLSSIPVLGLLALSLNSLTAATGQLSLGHVGLYGLGAFMCGVAVTTWELPSPLGLVVAMAVTGAVSFLLGLVALRIRGLYLAVLTLSFAVLLEAFVFPRPAFSRGGAGLRVPRPEWFGIDFGDDRAFLVLCVVAVGIVWWLDRWVLGSPLGRAMLAVRQNETAAAARGIHAPSVKVICFVLSGIGAGLAGALYAWRQGIVVATSFPVSASFTLILYVVLGGIGSRIGVFAITAVFAWTSTWSTGGDVLEWLTIVGSALIILQIGQHPEGLAGINRALLAGLRRRARPQAE